MNRQKAAAVTAAAVAAAGIVTSAAFDTPLELLEPVPLEETLEADASDSGTAGTEERQRGPLARFRRWTQRVPGEARALVGVPLWWLGTALTESAVLLWTAAASPAAACLIRWLLLAAVAVLVFAASVKAAIPDVPVKRLLRPRSLAPLLGTAALLAAADLALTSLDRAFTLWAWRTGAFLLFSAVCADRIRKEKSAALEEAARRAEEPLSRSAVENLARHLADSVCAVRFHTPGQA